MEISFLQLFSKNKQLRKLTYRQRTSLCQLLSDLLVNGFNLNQACEFIAQTNFYPEWVLQVFKKNLKLGNAVAESFATVGYSAEQIAQIELANVHGNLANTLKMMAKNMSLVKKERDNLVKVASYPALLLLFVLTLILGMRSLLLPQLIATNIVKETSLSYYLINNFPKILGISLLILSLLYFCLKHYFKQQSKISKTTTLCRLPGYCQLAQKYYAAHFSLEFGNLFSQGLELSQIVYCLEQMHGESLLKEVAQEMQGAFTHGVSLTQQIASYSFFTREFSLIIEQGTLKGQLGAELLIYSELLTQQMFTKIERLVALIQPLVFLLIAAVVVAIYAAMLLPMYQMF